MNAALRSQTGPSSSARPKHRPHAVPALRSRLATVKPLPAVVERIRQVATDSRKTVADVAAVVERDVAFSIRLLKLVNSAAVGLSKRCTSVRHAAVLLGVRRIAALATATAAVEFIEQASSASPAVTRHALAVAKVARTLATYSGVSAEDAFTAGLLHDVGMLLILQSGDSLYEELLDQSGPDGEPNPEEEQALLGFDHAELGAEALRRWNLPEPLPQVVEFHHDWEGALHAGSPATALVAVVRIADLLAPRLEARSMPEEQDLEALRQEPGTAFLNLPPDDLIRMWADLRAALTSDIASEPLPSETTTWPAPPSLPAIVVVPAPPPEARRVSTATLVLAGGLAAAASLGGLLVYALT